MFQLSRRLYPKDEIEWMILRCLLVKSEHSEREILYWVSEICTSFGQKEAWVTLMIFAYALYSTYNNAVTQKIELYLSSYHNMYEHNEKDNEIDTFEMPCDMIRVVKTIFRKTPNTTLYTFIKLYMNKEWKKVSLYPERNETRSNLFLSLDKKHLQNILFYAHTMDQTDWIKYIKKYKNIDTETSDVFDPKEWRDSFISLLDILWDIKHKPSNRSLSLIKASPEDIEWLKKDETTIIRQYEIHPEINHLKIERKQIKYDTNEWYKYIKETPYWIHQMNHEEMKIDEDEELFPYTIHPLTDNDMKYPIWYLPDWIINNPKSKKIYSEFSK